MTVNPGWGGQSFIASSPDKIARLRALLGDDVELEVDGGIDAVDRGRRGRRRRHAVRRRQRPVRRRRIPAQAYRDIAAAAGV